MKRIFLISIFLVNFCNAFSQKNKTIYFFADTSKLNISKTSKIVDIKWTTPLHYSFIFHCDYKAPYYNYLEFSSWIDKKKRVIEMEYKKPKHNYIDLKELLSIAQEHPLYFNDIYDLFIVEALPGKKFRTYKVELMQQSAPIIDYEIINRDTKPK